MSKEKTTLEFCHNAHRGLANQLKQMVSDFNGISVSPQLARFIDATPISAIDTAAVIEADKLAKLAPVSGIQAMLNAGLNLLSLAPTDANFETELQAIADRRTVWHKHEMRNLHFISYDAKQKAFAVNDAGRAALDACVIRFEGADKQTFELVNALALHLLNSYESSHLRRFLNSEITCNWGRELSEESLASAIKIAATPLRRLA